MTILNNYYCFVLEFAIARAFNRPNLSIDPAFASNLACDLYIYPWANAVPGCYVLFT